MARGAAAETSPSVWRYWAARLTLQRVILQEQFSGLQSKREKAEKRAKAAEMIAQEANVARLKTLLDAAREQATVKTIASAEQRFADARGDFEAAHQAFSPAEDAGAGHAPAVDRAATGGNAMQRSTRAVMVIEPKTGLWVSARGIAGGVVVLIAAAIGAAYLFGDADSGAVVATEARPAAPSKDIAAVSPHAPEPSPVAPTESPAVMPSPPAVAARPEDVVPKAAGTGPVEPVKAARAEPAAAAATTEGPMPASGTEAAPIRTAAVMPMTPSAPPAKPARTMPDAPPTPRPNPFRFTAIAQPIPAPPPPAPPFRLPE